MKKNKSLLRKFADKISRRGSIEKTIAEWEKLLAFNKDGNTYNIVGDLYLKQKDTDRAIDAFQKAADAFREKGYTFEAIAMNRKISNISPSELGAKVAMAELNAEKGLAGNAIEHYLEAAEAYSARNEVETSLQLYEKALALAPNNPALKVRIAEIYHTSDLCAEALKLYEDAASMYLNVGDDNMAKKYFMKAITLNAESSRSLTGLSVIEERCDNMQQAFKYARDAVLSTPYNQGAIARLAELASRAGYMDDALHIISELVKSDPSNVQLRKSISTIYIATGMVDKAWSEMVPLIDDYLEREEWNDAMDLLKLFQETDLVVARQRLARLYGSRGDMEAAVNELKEIAKIFRRRDKVSCALQSYQEAAEIDPGNQEILLAIKDLEEGSRERDIDDSKEAVENREESFAGADSGEDFEEEESVFGVLDKDSEKEIENLLFCPAPEEVAIEETNDAKGSGVEQGGKSASPESREEMCPTISVDLEVKRNEAEFYEMHGFINKAISAYGELLSLQPGDQGIEERLLSLKLRPVPTIDPDKESFTMQDASGEKDSNMMEGFPEGSEQETRTECQTHYDLGIACMEKGLVEEAIREFRLASRDPLMKVRCRRQIAGLYMESEDYQNAAEELEKLVQELPEGDGEYLHIKKEIRAINAKNKNYINTCGQFREDNAKDPHC